MSYRRVTVSDYGAAAISAADMKLHLRETDDDDDTLIEAYTEAATRLVEKKAGTALRSQTWTLALDRFDRRCIQLPGGLVTAVSSVKYYDLDKVQQTLAADQYIVTKSMVPAVVEAPNGWPGTQSRVGAVEIAYTVGDSALAGLLQAVRLIVAHWYENREATSQKLDEMPIGIGELVNADAAGWYG